MCLSILQSLSICTSSDQKTPPSGKQGQENQKCAKHPPPFLPGTGGGIPPHPCKTMRSVATRDFTARAASFLAKNWGEDSTLGSNHHRHTCKRERALSSSSTILSSYTTLITTQSEEFRQVTNRSMLPNSSRVGRDDGFHGEARASFFSSSRHGLLRCYQRSAADCVGRLPECDKKALETF